ncbi:MAG: molybdopterin-binding protein [Deltaproteobacteria bacterium]|jgi:molybdenum cofactor synthesis domain-containing protein|nr:molybdopterin-binding protein [Deltaproteobacteria bacterium]
MASKTVPVEEAVGMVLPHDVTEIRLVHQQDDQKDSFKGAAFKKGHVIRQEDVPHLKRLGKDHIYVLSLEADEIHENEAAHIMAQALAGAGVVVSGEPTEGKLSLVADFDGILKVDVEKLYAFNLLGEVMCSSLHTNTPVRKGTQVAATRLIPLTSKKEVVHQAAALCPAAGVFQVKALRKARAGLIITGNEVFYGRIKDAFEPVLRKKLMQLGSSVVKVAFAPDDIDTIAAEIKGCLAAGADLIITSGGMSVDPDDVTRMAIAKAGATDVVYGTPVLPGAMFLVGTIGAVPVMGLPACGMFHRITVFDLVLPRVLAGETITRADLARLGHGGLCSICQTCTYPICHFGK